MKIAIVGASGLIGSSLMREMRLGMENGCQIIGTYNRNPFSGGVPLDISDREKVGSFITFYRPDVLVWLAGLKDLTLLEKTPKLGFLLNEQPINNLVDLLKTNNLAAKVIYVSSDYVFDGGKGAYTVADSRGPDTIYGRSKVYAEDKLAELEMGCVNIRTSAVMSTKGGFLRWFLKQIEQGDVHLYTNTIFSPTPAVSFSRAIIRIIQKSLWGSTLHFAGEPVSRYRFGRKIAALLGKDEHRIIPDSADLEHSTFHKNLSLITSKELQDLMPGEADLLLELKRNDQICR